MSSNEYRRNAAECLRVCALIGDPDSRRVLTSVAEAWNRLADQADKDEKVEQSDVASSAEPSDGLRLLLKELKNTAVAELDWRLSAMWWRLFQIGCAALAGCLVYWFLPGPPGIETGARILGVGVVIVGGLAGMVAAERHQRRKISPSSRRLVLPPLHSIAERLNCLRSERQP